MHISQILTHCFKNAAKGIPTMRKAQSIETTITVSVKTSIQKNPMCLKSLP